METEQQSKWVEYRSALKQAYNKSIHSTTDYALSYLMFGRHVHMSVDLLLGTAPTEEAWNETERVGHHHERLSYTYKKVSLLVTWQTGFGLR